MNRRVNVQATFIAAMLVVAALVGLFAATADAASYIGDGDPGSIVRTFAIPL